MKYGTTFRVSEDLNCGDWKWYNVGMKSWNEMHKAAFSKRWKNGSTMGFLIVPNRMITARTGISLLVAILINCISPLVLRTYESRFRAQPTIPLTEFTLYRLPYVLLLLSFGMLVGSFCIRRCSVEWRSTFENFLTCLVVIGCILYLFGIILPFITYQIGLN